MAFAEKNDGLARVMSAFDITPSGGTPLCYHITSVVAIIRNIEPQLRANAQKATIIICTDGEASDGNVIEALRPLQNMPVQIVLRLCTDDDRISLYWKKIDEDLELNMDVIDDFTSEALEVHKLNPWLTYGEPLYFLRAFGLYLKEFDLLDEIPLSAEQAKAICSYMYVDIYC